MNFGRLKKEGEALARCSVRILGQEHAQFPGGLNCDHGCEYVIQLVNQTTDAIELEFCPMAAEQMAGCLLEAVELCHLSE